MAKVISQETFDDVVKENIVDFSMSPEEAKQESIKQFEAQGVNLANIIKDLSINKETGQPVLNETIEQLKTYVTSEKSTHDAKLIAYLNVLDAECQKSIPHRVLAGKNGAHEVLIKLLQQEVAMATASASTDASEKPDLSVLEKCLHVMNSLLHKQPDLFNEEALTLAVQLLSFTDERTLCLTLQWLQKASVMHEMNRQRIMKANILSALKPLVVNASKTDGAPVLREALTTLRYLVLDDDVRVEFGCAHEHARQIAGAVLVEVTQLLGDFEDVNILAEVLLTIGTLAVRQELCTVIEDAGGLKLLLDIMTGNVHAVRLNREALKLLRALAGNDAIKIHIVQQGAAPIIRDVLQTHQSNEPVVTAALACVSTLTLRVPENSAAFFASGIAELIVEVIRLHPQSKIVQRNGAWAVRNMVSRSRDQCETWLSYGIEDLLNSALREHTAVQQDIKAALRDLGCKVDLKEEWTGTAEKKILNNNIST